MGGRWLSRFRGQIPGTKRRTKVKHLRRGGAEKIRVEKRIPYLLRGHYARQETLATCHLHISVAWSREENSEFIVIPRCGIHAWL